MRPFLVLGLCLIVVVYPDPKFLIQPWTMSEMVKYKGSELIKKPKRGSVFHHVWHSPYKQKKPTQLNTMAQFFVLFCIKMPPHLEL